MADVSHDDGFHGACDPDTCFAAKMAYMREHGGLSVHYPYGGRKVFSGPTLGERIRREQAMAKAAGNEIRPVNPLYDRPAKFKVDT